MSTPVTVLVTVDASGAIRGSQQAQQAITTAVNNITGTTQRMGAQTATASRFLERFGDAPKRGISALDALNSTIIQATGGFQALGPASAAASTGLRAALFAVSSFLGPVGTITIALAGLAAIFAFTGNKAEAASQSIIAQADSIKNLADSLDRAATSAKIVVNEMIRLDEIKLAKLREEQIEALKAAAGMSDKFPGFMAVIRQALGLTDKTAEEGKEKFLKLTAEIAKLVDELEKLKSPSANAANALKEFNKQADLQFALLTKGVAATQAQATTIAEYNSQIIKGIQLQIQQQGLTVSQAATIEAVNAAHQATILLLQKELDLQLQGILTTEEQANKRIEFENKVLQAQMAADNQVQQIENRAKQATRELERQYQRLADIIAAAFFTSHQSILESFRELLRQMAQDWLASGLADLIGEITGKKKGGFNFFTDVALPIGLAFLLKPAGGRGPESSSGSASTLRLPSGGGGTTNIVINVQALDTETLTQAVRNKVIPIIENAAAGRRTRIALA